MSVSLFTLAVAAPVVWFLAALSLAPIALAAFFIRNPGALTKGQDAAGKGMAVGCAVAALGALSLAISIATAIVTGTSDDPLDTITRIAGYGPLVGLVLAGIGTYIAAQIKRGS